MAISIIIWYWSGNGQREEIFKYDLLISTLHFHALYVALPLLRLNKFLDVSVLNRGISQNGHFIKLYSY